MTTQKNTQPNVEDNAPKGVALSDAEQVAARHEGAKEAVKEIGKAAYTALTDGVLPGQPAPERYAGSDDIGMYAHVVEMTLPEFEARVADKALPENKVAGLLKLERAGQNRTPYVRALCKRLGVKDPREVTDAGPGYTNDLTAVTAL